MPVCTPSTSKTNTIIDISDKVNAVILTHLLVLIRMIIVLIILKLGG